MEETYKEPIFLQIAGQQEIFSQIVEYLTLSDVGKLFPLIQQRQSQRDVVVRTAVTFRPSEILLKTIVRRGFLRQEREKIHLSKKSFKSLFIPALASGVTWEKMRNLYRFIRSVPLDFHRKNNNALIRFETSGTTLKFSSNNKWGRFKNFDMKIWLPCHRCHGKQCDRTVFRTNKCAKQSHRGVVAHYCKQHESRLGCGLCREEEEEEDDECFYCGGDVFSCDSCTELFCPQCDGGYSCDSCQEVFCGGDYCYCTCGSESDEDNDDDDDENEDEDENS